MIMSQEQAFLKADAQLVALCQFVRGAGREKLRMDEVERELFSQLLLVGLTLLEAHVAAQGDGDAGPTLEAEGHEVQRLAEPRERRYLSIFGELVIRRFVYARREGQKVERSPLDQKLGMPAGEFSYVLEDWLQRLCVKDSFHEACQSLRMLLGLCPSERAAEAMNQRLAQQAESFRAQAALPPPREEGPILVVTADGKGVPMRRPIEERVRTAPRRGKGEKANKKQMAYVGAVYSIDRFLRTADDVVEEIDRRQRARDRPVPQHKHVWAEMTTLAEGAVATGRERVFIELAVAAHERDPTHRKPLVCLMDGEVGLWEMQREWLPRSIGILDLFHVLERLWQAAHCFHPETSPQAEQFVTRRLRQLLTGKVNRVIRGLRRLLKQRDLHGQKRRTLQAVIRYYRNNRQHMRYDEYLAAGYPIGSGVAEGACRHLVKDRLELTGMRWTVNGAQAMLHLRAIYLNGDWDDYIAYYIHTEQTTLYQQTAA
ncbi:MAG: ISKra4 family transposase [Acidobacteria bacterium]|nr:ISKra4 family transposase [Acidobacteriota bacterium]